MAIVAWLEENEAISDRKKQESKSKRNRRDCGMIGITECGELGFIVFRSISVIGNNRK